MLVLFDHLPQALKLLEVMWTCGGELVPDIVSYNTVMKACGNAQQTDRAFEVRATPRSDLETSTIRSRDIRMGSRHPDLLLRCLYASCDALGRCGFRRESATSSHRRASAAWGAPASSWLGGTLNAAAVWTHL